MTTLVEAQSLAIAHSLEASSRRIGVELAADQTAALLRFNALLQRWNAVYNLTAVREPKDVLTLHTLDCLAAVGPLRRALLEREGTVLDVGSGGGLPGVVFAITNPQVHVTCIDAVGKKVAFITQAAADLKLRNLTAVHKRVETFTGSFEVITARAFSSLKDFVDRTAHLRGPTGVWMAMKGKEPHAEMAELPEDVMFHVEHLNVPGLTGERCLVWVRPSTDSRRQGGA